MRGRFSPLPRAHAARSVCYSLTFIFCEYRKGGVGSALKPFSFTLLSCVASSVRLPPMSSSTPTEPQGVPAVKAAPSALSKARPFIVGGLSGCIATCCIQPVDMVKVRLQLVGEGGAKASTSPIQVLRNVLKNEGVLALYKGLDAGIIRQVRLHPMYRYTQAR